MNSNKMNKTESKLDITKLQKQFDEWYKDMSPEEFKKVCDKIKGVYAARDWMKVDSPPQTNQS